MALSEIPVDAAAPPARRDFLTILTLSAAAVGAAAVAWPFIDAIGPDRAAQAVARPIIDVGAIAADSGIAITWDGLPIFIRKLTAKQIADNQFTVTDTLADPADYAARVKPGYETFVVLVALNTAIPCEVLGLAPTDPRGPFDGWLCPCDGSVYDPLGRVRGGPARRNLAIPRFTFLNDTQIQFG